MKRWIWAFLFLMGIGVYQITAQHVIKSTIDLKGIKNDKVTVTVIPPKFQKNRVVFQLPTVIPGSYEIKNYSRFIDTFMAFDHTGKPLKTKQNNAGYYIIKQAKKAAKIQYTVHDTWDDSIKDRYIFPPGGTNFNQEKNFVLNLFTLVGYFHGYESLAYDLDILKPTDFFGSSGVEILASGPEKDNVLFESYADLAEHPILYAQSDTCSFYQGQTRINICTYSPNGVVSSNRLKPMLEQVMQTMEFFFDSIPVPEYTFLFYFAGEEEAEITRFDEYGALEHKTSSLYFLPEIHSEKILFQTISTIAAHEFLHILTPLRLRSDAIATFDFTHPAASKHLWLYEGVVEYLSNWALMVNGVMSQEDFVLDLRRKLIQAGKYADVSFTKMSEKILDEPWSDMFSNVYHKGALLAFFLDIEINELTQGKKNLRTVILELNQQYPDGIFTENSLINDMVKLVHPDLASFFSDYVEKNTSIPIDTYAKKIGWVYYPERADSTYTFGNVAFNYAADKQAYVVEPTSPRRNIFKLSGGEKIASINGVPLTRENYLDLVDIISNPKSMDKVLLKVENAGMSYSMEAEPMRVRAFQLHDIRDSKYATSKEIQLKEWVFDK